jgi:hypothetical protein
VQDENGLVARRADRRVMQAEFGHDFARMKAEVAREEVALFRSWIIRCRGFERDQRGRGEREHARRQFFADVAL